MITDFELIASVLIEDCNEVSKGLKPLVDVGGSTGTMARAIATAFPDTKCTVFDLPLVVDNMVGTNNLDFFGGNMFEAIPPPNAVLLKIFNNYSNLTKLTNQLTWWILHDWSDEESLKILKKCKESTPSTDEGGKGKERSVCDWKKLFLAAGFSHYKITPNLGLWSLIEAYP
ncbi:hypothetical protein WN944_006160 [Citrus x changshan-huyou]|uniref:O-methyltransferase C-terminal domain-containing protein n=1 Tax=Citrus x changshan-huyou TaxID=2935761 RepID=A0AAP0QWY3_9ROSI